MNSILSVLFISLLSIWTVAVANAIGIAATVQGKEIKELKLQRAVESYLRQQGTNVGAIRDPNRYKAVRKKVLDVLIGQELLWQAAKKDKIIADDEDVNQAYKEYQSRFNNEMSFNIKLKEEGFNETSFLKSLKQQLSVQKWINQYVYEGITVSKSDVHDFYVENKQQFIEPEKIRARHILIKLKPNASQDEKKQAKGLLSDIKKKIASGEKFEVLAKQHSQDASAQQGGDLGYFARGQMVKPFEVAAFDLAPGEVSEIIETRFGFHLITVVDTRPAAQYEEDVVSGNIRSYLWQQKYQQALEDVVTRLKQSASIEKSAL